MSNGRGILARGPWQSDQIEARWRDDAFEPPADVERQADAAVNGLRERGSPAHDGVATRLAGWREEDGRLVLDLQPVRWALRLLEDACDSLTALCVGAHRGRPLAGRPAGRLGLDLGEPLGARRGRSGRPGREPRRDALARAPRGVAARAAASSASRRCWACPTGSRCWSGSRPSADAADPVPDHEHDEWAWWPADVDAWPAEADGRLKLMARLLG